MEATIDGGLARSVSYEVSVVIGQKRVGSELVQRRNRCMTTVVAKVIAGMEVGDNVTYAGGGRRQTSLIAGVK